MRLNSVQYHSSKRMTLKRTTLLTSGLLFISFLLLLTCGLAFSAAARSQRGHKAKAHAATLSYATVLRGRASWYGRKHQGKLTSSGERFNRFKYTCAHKSLPFGTRLRVTNIKTGKSVVVRVSDRGPFRHKRILDLAEIAAQRLDIVSHGAASVIAQVVPATTPLGPAAAPRNLLALRAADPNPGAAFTTYQLVSQPDKAPKLAVAPAAATNSSDSSLALATTTDQAATTPAADLHFVVQAGSFPEAQSAQAMQAYLLSIDPTLPVSLVQTTADGQLLNQVLIEQLDTWLAAETIRRRLQSWGIVALVRQTATPPVVAQNSAASSPVVP